MKKAKSTKAVPGQTKSADATDVHVGRRIKLRRVMTKISQSALGDALGITFQQVQKYEKGTNRVSASKLQQMANILDVPVSYFFEDGPLTNGAAPISPLSKFSDVLATRDGVALCTAFRKLDPALQHKLVKLTQRMAVGRKAGGATA